MLRRNFLLGPFFLDLVIDIFQELLFSFFDIFHLFRIFWNFFLDLHFFHNLDFPQQFFLHFCFILLLGDLLLLLDFVDLGVGLFDAVVEGFSELHGVEFALRVNVHEVHFLQLRQALMVL
jgi:hypothetical protein